MAIAATKLQDAQLISQAFERGCNFSNTEESVYAVMSPSLCTMKNMARSVKSIVKDNPIQNQINSAAKDSDTLDKIAKQVKECIPCNLRIDWEELLTANSMNMKLFDYFTNYFAQVLEQIKAMAGLLNGDNQYLDICDLLGFFKDFVCIPDLRRLLAALSAFLMQLGLELSSMFDFIMLLIGPIMMPFLNEIIEQLNLFILTAIEPLECIINALTTQISKLDYGSIFANRQTEGRVNLTLIANTQDKKDHEAILKAENELKIAQLRTQSINPNDSLDTINSVREAERKARDNYQKTLRNRDLTVIGKATAGLTKALNSTRSTLLNLVKYVQQVIDFIHNLLSKVLGDFTGLLNKLLGGGTGLIIKLNDKLAVIQLIKIIKSIIDKNPNCNATNVLANVVNNATIYEDLNGNIVIEDNSNITKDAIDKAIQGMGRDKNLENLGVNSSPSDKIKSIIKYTGNPVLDSSINETITSITQTKKVTLKCNANTSVESAEQVNKWISELSNI